VSAADQPGGARPVSFRQRMADRVLSWLLRRGKGPAFMRLLTVRGRRSGTPRTTPVVPVERDGDVWLVSPFGDVQWVRNVRATGEVELWRGPERTTYRIRELDPNEAVPVIREYLSMPSERFVRKDFDVTAESSAAAIETEAPRHPVFELTPVG
jgi:deazaflavin-dependent oxidoreductase (nitroreductase family)